MPVRLSGREKAREPAYDGVSHGTEIDVLQLEAALVREYRS